MNKLNTTHGTRLDQIPFLSGFATHKAITFRRYKGRDDHEIIAKLSQEYWDSIGLDYVISADDVARSLKYMDNFNPWKNVLLVEIAGVPAGFTEVNWHQESEGARIYRFKLRVTPNGFQHQVHKPLLQFAEGRLRELARRHLEGEDRFYATTASESDMYNRTHLEANGYQPERYYFDMMRPLTISIPEYALPQGIELRAAEPHQCRKVIAALNEAFLDHWGHRPITESEIQWYMASPQFQPELWKIAWDGDEVVGMVLNYIDEAENDRFARKRGYTEDIAVRKPWRRRGIAKSLIAYSLQTLRNQGMLEAALGVDTQNPSGALRLYQSLGYQESRKYIHYRKRIST